MTAKYLRWLEKNGHAGLEEAAAAFATISETAKSLQFKMARAVRAKKPVDVTPIDEMAAAWDTAMSSLVARFGA